MMKIYFGYPIMGSKQNIGMDDLFWIQKILEELGFSLAKQYQPEIAEKERKNMAPKDIYNRDFRLLQESDASVFEMSSPDSGVGVELSDAMYLTKPIICIFKKELEQSVMAYIRGKTKAFFLKSPLQTYGYQNMEDLKENLKRILSGLK